jgi:signal transduction histidine kinase
MELDDNLPPVRMDSIRITQVLNNLLTNAIKYAPPDSEIRIRTRLLLAADDLPGGAPAGIVLPCVLVTVEDDGAGVAQDEVEKVFVPFFRSKEARASKVNGTGLGLTIARSIVERHRGKIWVEGRRRGRRGARFMFTLPLDAWL